MLVRNRVEDYDRWKTVFDGEAEMAREAGLNLTNLWRDSDDSQMVYYTFSVTDKNKADVFIEDPRSADAGQRAGVLYGELTYLEVASINVDCWPQ